MEGGKVMHVDADFTSGGLDDLMDNGLKTGLHELVSHAMGAGHRNNSGTLTYGNDVTNRFGNKDLSDSDRSLIVSFIDQKRANQGPTVVRGIYNLLLPNMSMIVKDSTGKPRLESISRVGFDTQKEIIEASKRQSEDRN